MDQTVQSLKDLRKGVFNERSKDLFLALLIAVIGLAGSYLVLGKSIQDSSKNAETTGFTGIRDFNLENFSATSEASQKNNFKYHQEYLHLQGTMAVGSIVRISNLAFQQDHSYLIDFGNGVRNRMTSSVVSRRYNSPGFYLIQCYVMIDSSWQLLSAETITIRKAEGYDVSGIQ
jgi:hypothetical protein